MVNETEYLNEMSKLRTTMSGLAFDLYIELDGEYRLKPDHEPRIKFRLDNMGKDSRQWPSLIIPSNESEPRIDANDKIRHKIHENQSDIRELIEFMKTYRTEFMKVWNGTSSYREFETFIKNQKANSQGFYSKNKPVVFSVCVRMGNSVTSQTTNCENIKANNEEELKSKIKEFIDGKLKSVPYGTAMFKITVSQGNKTIYEIKPVWIDHKSCDWDKPEWTAKEKPVFGLSERLSVLNFKDELLESLRNKQEEA